MSKSFKEKIEDALSMQRALSDNIEPGHEADNVWVVIACNNNGDEGLPAMFRDGVALPLMTTDFENVPKLKRMAREIIKEQPGIKRVVLRHFTNGVDEEL